MGRKARRGASHRDQTILRDALDHMEPDLKLLEGTVSVLRTLSETSDAVEPIAMEAVAYLARETVGRVSSRWRQARNALDEC